MGAEVTCLSCQHLNLRADKTMAANGYAGCTKLKSWHSVSVDKQKCDHFANAGKLVIDKRIEWREKQ